MGLNYNGQLGLGVAPNTVSPPVALPSPNGDPITTIALGNRHSAILAGVEKGAGADGSTWLGDPGGEGGYLPTR